MNFTDFKDGDIVMVHVIKFSTWYRWLLAQLIKVICGVWYHHDQTYYNGKLYEADILTRAINIEHNEDNYIMVLRLINPLDSAESSKLGVEIHKLLDHKYDYLGVLFSQPIYQLSGRRLWLGKKGRASDRRLYSTEFSATLMNRVRGYFANHWLIGPHEMVTQGSLYYKVIYEGKA